MLRTIERREDTLSDPARFAQAICAASLPTPTGRSCTRHCRRPLRKLSRRIDVLSSAPSAIVETDRSGTGWA